MSIDTVPEDVRDIMFALEYRERFGLSQEQFEREPWEMLAAARWKWSYQAQANADSSSNGTGSVLN